MAGMSEGVVTAREAALVSRWRRCALLVEVFAAGRGRIKIRTLQLGREPLTAREQSEVLLSAAADCERRAAAVVAPVEPDRVLPPVETLLAVINERLTRGAPLSGSSLALRMLCEHLGVDRDGLIYEPGWASD
jgi:hypothetical protein